MEIRIIRPVSERRKFRKNIGFCPLCGEPLGEWATSDFLYVGISHHICASRILRWFFLNNNLVNWDNLEILDRFDNIAINGNGIKK